MGLGTAHANAKECMGWAARDSSGHLAPFHFKRRSVGPKDVGFKISYCGICHSDLHQIRNEFGGSIYLMVPGKCVACQKKVEQYCSEGFTRTYNCKDSKDSDGTITYGGYSNYMVITEDPMKYFQMKAGGKDFGVVGLGGLGHMAVKIAKVLGMNVTVISMSPSKEEEARKRLGADNFIVSTDEEQMRGAKGTLDFIIDSAESYVDLLRVNGKFITVGAARIDVPSRALIFGGSIIGGIAETQEMLDFCGKHNIVCEIEKISMDYVNTAVERLAKGDVHYRFVIDCENAFKALDRLFLRGIFLIPHQFDWFQAKCLTNIDPNYTPRFCCDVLRQISCPVSQF